MREPSYLIELSANYFNVYPGIAKSKGKLINVTQFRDTCAILLNRYCALEAYKIAEIFDMTEQSVRSAMTRARASLVVLNAIEHIEFEMYKVNEFKNKVV